MEIIEPNKELVEILKTIIKQNGEIIEFNKSVSHYIAQPQYIVKEEKK